MVPRPKSVWLEHKRFTVLSPLRPKLRCLELMRLGALPRPDRNRHDKNTRDLVFYPLSLLLDNLMGGLFFQNRQSSFKCLSLPSSVDCSLLTTSGIPKAYSKLTMGGDPRFRRRHYYGAACFFFPSSLEPLNFNSLD